MRWRLEVEALAMNNINELGRLLFHLDHKTFDPTPEVAEEDHCRYRDDKSEPRVVQRHRDAVSKLLRIRPGRRLRAKNLDHANHGAEKTHERADRGDGSERSQESLELVGDGAPGFLDRILHDVARTLVITQARSENFSERRILRQLDEHLIGNALPLVGGDHLLQQTGRHDLFFAQYDEPLDDERHCDDRNGEKEIYRPTRGLNDGEQPCSRSGQSPRTL